VNHLSPLHATTDSEESTFCLFCDGKVVPSIDQGRMLMDI
jgi:calcineurin-like phosphoesterase